MLISFNQVFLVILLLSVPKVETGERVYDFGKVDEGEKVKHVFRIKNVGDDTLIIKKVLTSCGCTAAGLTKRKLSPGEETEIEVTFNTKGFIKNQRKTVTLWTNDPENESVRFILKGFVRRPPSPILKVIPRMVNLGKVNASDTVKFKIKLKNVGERDLVINKIESEGIIIDFSTDTLAPGVSKEITLSYWNDTPGNYTEFLKIFSNDRDRPVNLVAVRVKVIKDEE
jgi:hypothetical protein